MLNYNIIDFDLKLSNHLPVLATSELNIETKMTPTEAVPANDAHRQVINNKRLGWDRANCSSYYNATNDCLPF